VSADDADPADPADAVPGIDLARAALAEARASARERAGKPGTAKSVTGRRGRRLGDARDPQLFGEAISGLITDRGWEVPAAVGDARDRWGEIVGQDIAAHAEPLSFTDGVLVVQASSTAWATQLRLLAPEIVRRLNRELGHNTVVRIDVKAPRGPSWKKGRLRVQDGRGPRDTYG
jgi:predicted nucleic acid-binding Zn ribbon protein